MNIREVERERDEKFWWGRGLYIYKMFTGRDSYATAWCTEVLSSLCVRVQVAPKLKAADALKLKLGYDVSYTWLFLLKIM